MTEDKDVAAPLRIFVESKNLGHHLFSSRPADQLSLAIGAHVVHRLRAGFTEGALERADEGRSVGRQGGAAFFAFGPELECHRKTLQYAIR
jgi:hypothetical protein